MKVTFGKSGNAGRIGIPYEQNKGLMGFLPRTDCIENRETITRNKKLAKNIKIAGLAALAGLLATAGVFFAKTAQKNNDKKEVRQTEIVQNNDTSVNSSVKKK